MLASSAKVLPILLIFNKACNYTNCKFLVCHNLFGLIVVYKRNNASRAVFLHISHTIIRGKLVTIAVIHKGKHIVKLNKVVKSVLASILKKLFLCHNDWLFWFAPCYSVKSGRENKLYSFRSGCSSRCSRNRLASSSARRSISFSPNDW